MPGIDLPSGIKTLNPVPVEFWSGPYTGADETAAKLAANTAIPSAVRFLTMEVSLIIAGIGYKYWYKDGIADLDLVKVDTDISNLVTLNTNQTITGEKTFNGGDLKLQGYDNVNAVSLTYDPGVGTGTVVFPDASGGTAKTIAYRDWVTNTFTFLQDVYVTTVDFINTTDCEIPSFDGLRFRINWRGYGFLIPVIEWETLTGGGFRILIPGFDVTLDPNNTFQIQQY